MSQLFFKINSFSSKKATQSIDNVSPFFEIDSFEVDALAHWIFDKNSPSVYTDLSNEKLLSLQPGATTSPLLSEQGAKISTKIGNSLLSNIYSEANEDITMSFVAKLESVSTAASTPVMLMGCLPTTGIGQAIWYQSGTSAGLHFATRSSSTESNRIASGVDISSDQYFFASLSINKVSKQMTLYARNINGEGNAIKAYTIANAKSSNPIALGSSHYGNEAITNATFEEAIIHPRALTLSEMQDLADRVATRCAKRGIIF